MAGLVGIVFISMFNTITIDNESEYYVLKEAMEAAMLESVDLVCFASDEQEGCGGTVKISEQKFVENFTRRFSNNINGNVEKYQIEFYDIIESPPKATVVIKGLTETYTIISDDGFEINNSLSGILEHKLDIKTENINNGNNKGNIILPENGEWTIMEDNREYTVEPDDPDDAEYKECESTDCGSDGDTIIVEEEIEITEDNPESINKENSGTEENNNTESNNEQPNESEN